MVISFDKIVNEYDLKIAGVLHIGAHYGEEYGDYVKHGIENMIFFEPILSNYEELFKRVPMSDRVFLYKYALGSSNGEADMYVETENNGQSCSILEPDKHLTQYPHIKFLSTETVTVKRLDDIPFNRGNFNMINMDVQGYELEVLKGATETLNTIDIIYTEVNRDEVYKKCAKVGELDEFLSSWNFTRVITNFIGGTWGDALYLKQNTI